MSACQKILGNSFKLEGIQKTVLERHLHSAESKLIHTVCQEKVKE